MNASVLDLVVRSDLRTLTRIWTGDETVADAQAAQAVQLMGAPAVVERFPAWLGHHPVLGGVASAC